MVIHGNPTKIGTPTTLTAKAITALIMVELCLSGTVAQSRSVYDKLLFEPRKEYRSVPEELDGIATKNVSFTTSGGEHLHGWYYDQPNSDKIVLVSEGVGGNMGYLTKLAEILLQCNASVLLYDYEGYGESEGSPSLQHIVDDARAAFDYMSKTLAGNKKKILLGVSLGTGVTCQLSTLRKADAIILTSPFTSLLKIARQKSAFVKYMPTFALPRQHLDNEAVLKKPHPPLLILHGTKDTFIPISESEELFAQADEPKTFVRLPNVGHNDIFRNSKDEYLAAVKAFFEKLN
jgi:fermentation-respiration switch protein FrsA (DUF1100 family)